MVMKVTIHTFFQNKSVWNSRYINEIWLIQLKLVIEFDSGSKNCIEINHSQQREKSDVDSTHVT